MKIFPGIVTRVTSWNSIVVDILYRNERIRKYYKLDGICLEPYFLKDYKLFTKNDELRADQAKNLLITLCTGYEIEKINRKLEKNEIDNVFKNNDKILWIEEISNDYNENTTYVRLYYEKEEIGDFESSINRMLIDKTYVYRSW